MIFEQKFSNYQKDWDKHLTFFPMTFKLAVSRSTGQTQNDTNWRRNELHTMWSTIWMEIGRKPNFRWLSYRLLEEMDDYVMLSGLGWFLQQRRSRLALPPPQRKIDLPPELQKAWRGLRDFPTIPEEYFLAHL